MKVSKTSSTIDFVLIAAILLAYTGVMFGAENETDYFPSFSDDHTVGLWLFDETEYPYTTITDASKYEYDLRLMKGGRIVPGKFGNCLKLTPGLDPAVGYSSWKGHISFAHLREVSGRPGSGLWGPTVAPEKLLDAAAGSDFTCEFWIMLMSNPIQDVVIVDFGDKYEAGFKVTLKKRAAGFVIENTYAGFKAECPTLLEQLWGRAWHHVAFTYPAGGKKLGYFIDGKFQGDAAVGAVGKSKVPPTVWPESLNHTTSGIFEKARSAKRPGKVDKTAIPDFEKRRKNRFNFAIGQSRSSELKFNGNIDELRFSDVIRYTADFPLPDSFSRNYRKNAPKPAVANGDPLLFGAEKTYLPNEPVMLGSRKHVFIDEVMIDRNRGVRLTMNPLTKAASTNVKVRGGWDIPFFDHDGKIWMFLSPAYMSDVGRYRLMLSTDGVDFTAPDLGLIEDEGSKHNNIILTHTPSWGGFFKDTNPNAHPEERFKAAAWVAQRGIYLYMSPDGVHWRRNETCMLPLVSGGGTEMFWDDQQGVYCYYIKRDGSYNTGDFPNYGRSYCFFKTREAAKAWPFNRVPNPYFEGWAFPAVTGEGITIIGPNLINLNKEHVFRTRARKYEWAPDTYVSFLERSPNQHPPQLAVSRDAVNWNIFDAEDDGDYVPRGIKGDGYTQNGMARRSDAAKDYIYDGKEYGNAPHKNKSGYIQNGLVRRGDELWQYVNMFGANIIRFTQRLDGFVSLDTDEKGGIIITRPFIFEGEKLTLNVDAGKGSVKVAILDLPGQEMTGYNIGLTNPPKKDVRNYSIAHCETITSDSVRHVVNWRGSPDVASLAGKVVRLRFEMQNAKLYAFEFKE